MEQDYILKVEHVSKQFPGVKALDDVSIGVRRGTVHALVGENGAGKSTLIKILAGIYQSYEGSAYIDGKKVNFRKPSDAQAAGISVVHQELKLAESLSVSENIFLGAPVQRIKGWVDWERMNRQAQELTDQLRVKLDVTQPVQELTIAKKQIVEICKAIVHQCKVLIMDEPSATLTKNELDVLFETIRRLRSQGVTIIYISHRMEEIFQLADDVSILRDGKFIGTLPVAKTNQEELINMMVGREINVDYPRSGVTPGDVILSVRNLSTKSLLRDISFELRQGEILGIAGLVGAGRTELARAILGIDEYESGEVLYRGKPVHYKNFREAIQAGFGLVPEDRKQHGATQSFSIKENICMTNYAKVSSCGFVKGRQAVRVAEDYRKKLHIATPSIHALVQNLSGGNQQKVVIAKWLYRNSDILILDEPTRGIDVGAKREIYDLICSLVRNGKTVIVISSELPEVLGVSDRILVLHEGRKVGEMSAAEANQEAIMRLCV